jgi:cell division septal protein FtsQ
MKNDTNTNRTIAYNMLEKYRGQKLFKINNDKIKKELLSYQENLKEIKISKNYPNILEIKLSSYENIYLTKLNNKNYSITKN